MELPAGIGKTLGDLSFRGLSGMLHATYGCPVTGRTNGGFMLDERAKLTGKAAAIIGGGGGIGAAVTLALAECGVDVAFCDIDAASLARTEAQARAFGRNVLAVRADVMREAELDGFYARLAEAFPRLDIAVNVAGGTLRGPFMSKTRADYAADIRRNYGYVLDSVHHAVALMRRGKNGGSIVNFTTIEAHRGAATFAVYAGAKAATTNFTKAMAVELGGEGIRLNTVVPDTTNSQGNINAIPSVDAASMANVPPAALAEGLKMYIPLKTQPGTDALANAVLFLVSDLAASITGITLHVDGGTAAAAGFLDWPFGDGHLPVPFGGTLSRIYRVGDMD
jgi:NAD(P)-dependent dehydrogenase (short-subunit alcohol dehydrogenase family)